jgi:hypothetical protein
MEHVKYTKPNFENEWSEAVRYPEFKDMGKEKWLEIAGQGKPESFSKIKDVLGNVDLDFEGLEAPKKERFKQAFEKGIIEMSIAVKFGEDDYDLVAGNTRLSGLVKNGVDPKIWIVDISQPMKHLKTFESFSKQRLENLSESADSQKLAPMISKAIIDIDDSMSYVDFAQAVAQVLKDDYGKHNYEGFIAELKKNLK